MMVKHCIALDEDTTQRLEQLVEMSSTKTNKSLILRELIDKEFVLRKGARNEA